MKKLGIFMLLLAFAVVFLPVLILGGIGPGIKLVGIPTKTATPSGVDANTSKDTDKKSTKPVAGALRIKVFVKASNKIVEMPMEEYIVGVLAAEMPAKFHIEALKAQAVTARTYAVSKQVSYGGKGCVRHPGADICSDIHCQAWISKEQRLKSWKPSEASENWNKILSAVKLTEGQIISYKDKLASAVKYFSTSDGKTENSVYAFGYAAPYLVSVVSPNEEIAPNFKSTKIISRTEFISRIRKLKPKVELVNKNLGSQIRILSWTEGGRVDKIKIGSATFTGIQMRWAMELRSADFGIIIDGKNVKFNVRGNGHGVGLSQWGANEMGKRGLSYDKIVRHYFTGTEIMQLTAISMNKKSTK